MHADKREEIDDGSGGDIVAIMGIDCASGDTYAATAEVLLAREHVRARTGDPDRRSRRPTAAMPTGWAKRWPASAKKIRHSVSAPTRKPTKY